MTTVYVAQAVLENRIKALHTAILIVKSREELIEKLASRYNEFEIYTDYIEEAVPQNVLDSFEPDAYEVTSYRYDKCILRIVVYDKVELP